MKLNEVRFANFESALRMFGKRRSVLETRQIKREEGEREREREIEKGVDMETGRKHRPYRRRPWLRVADEEQPKRGELAIAGGCCIRGWTKRMNHLSGGLYPRHFIKTVVMIVAVASFSNTSVRVLFSLSLSLSLDPALTIFLPR